MTTTTTTTKTAKLTDDQIIKTHSPGVRGRAYIELQIVNKLIEEAKKAAYLLAIDGYNLDDMEPYGNDLKTALFDLDDAYVVVINSKFERVGWIQIIFGNDGYDIISDYSTGLEEFLKPVNELADYWGS